MGNSRSGRHPGWTEAGHAWLDAGAPPYANSEYTKGEWSIDPRNGDIVAGQVNVAILYATRPEDKRLMAASPDLLKALQAMIAWANGNGATCGYPGKQAADAIAKAIGEA